MTKEQWGFSTADKKRLGLMQKVQTSKAGEAAIHDVKAAGFGNQHLENINLVHLAVVDMEEGGNIVAQVEQRMHPACNLGGAEWCPRKDAQAQIDRRGIECVDPLFQFERKAVAGVNSPFLDRNIQEQRISKGELIYGRWIYQTLVLSRRAGSLPLGVPDTQSSTLQDLA